MKSIAFFLLFLGLVSVSMARQSAFLDDLFTPTINSIDTALINCTAGDTCAGKDDACVGTYPGSNGCSPANGTCCALGLYCVNKQCVINTEGATCTSDANCFGGDLTCYNGTCQYMMLVGEDCTSDSLCYSGKCNTTCQGTALGGSCTNINSDQCNFGLYCNFNGINGTCSNTTAQGSNCGPMLPPCFPGNVCFSKTFGNQSTCQAVGTQTAGLPCTTDACGSGLICNTAATNKTCVSVNTSSVACTATANCTNGVCVCSMVTGSSFCTGVGYGNPCTAENLAYTSCLAENMCQGPSDAPDSCAQTNCESDYKKTQSCGCSLANSQYGKCAYSQYCGGFPVWAIIVIIVVAIVLVLAIVLLVFFMMRRRRQYDSI